MRDNYANDARHAYIVNGASSANGIVFLNNVSETAFWASESHRQWGHGILYDNHQEVNPRHSDPMLSSCSHEDISLRLGHNYDNNGDIVENSGQHGWSTANAVAWNAELDGSKILVHKPPIVQNFVIGYKNGPVVNSYAGGPSFDEPVKPYIDHQNASVSPQSLYLAQLEDRGISAPSLSMKPLDHENISLHEVKESTAGFDIKEVTIHAFPNPFQSLLTFSYAVPKATSLKLELYDILGRRVSVIFDGFVNSGAQTSVFEAHDDLSPGIYFYRLVTDKTIKSGSVLLLH